MVASSNSKSLTSSVTTWKVSTKNYKRTDLPTQLWCNYCSESRNRSTREKVRSCFRPWVIKDDSNPHKKHITTLSKIISTMYCSLRLKKASNTFINIYLQYCTR